MTKVFADITMSIDGFVTGPDADVEHGLGVGGEPLHDWLASDDALDGQVFEETLQRAGAVVMGRNLFDFVDGPEGWSDELEGTPPYFVVTHSAPESTRLPYDFTFVTGGVEAAVEQARKAAGDKDVVVMGGGDVIAQTLRAGLVDEMLLHIAPIVLGAGTPLFHDAGRVEMRQAAVRVSPAATHATYAIA
jgi:dihydrofolate reductase